MPVERRGLALLLAVGAPLAASAADAPAAPPAPAPVEAELLEFLGEFHDAKGEFVDPFVIESVGAELDAAEREAKPAPKVTEIKPTIASPAPPAAQPEKQP